MSLKDAFILVDQINREIINSNTWGHLYPEPGRKYTGQITVAIGCYHHETIVLDDTFENLPNSPWQYDDLQEFISQATSNFETGIYRFKGWYKKFKNGNYQFGGGKFYHVPIYGS